MKRFAALLAASLAALVMSAGVAAAHAKLLSVRPADGSTVERPPVAVVLTYSEVVQNKGAQVAVIGPGGARVDQGAPDILDATVTQPLGQLTEPGTYKVMARIVSADGHPITDEATFTVRRAAPATAPPPPQSAPPAERATSTGAAVTAAGLFVVILTALATALVRHRRAGDLRS